jgi:hypothetical protein
MFSRRRPSLRTRSLLRLSALVVPVAMAAVRLDGQAPPVQTVSPFDMVGFIQKATLDSSSDVFSGGTMTVNGHVITVPRYTVLQMPATALTWQEVFAVAPLPYGLSGNGLSGLALTDSPTPLTTCEVHVQGNRVADTNGDRYIAGLIFISQQSLNAGQGYINYIDYARGEMRVGGTPGDPSTGARVRINDPLAKFSKGDSPDRRFTIDEDNPTVKTETAYPMCLPRTNPFGGPGTPGSGDDRYCPQRNRPQSKPPAYDMIVGGPFVWFSPNNPTGPDSLLPAPFEIGDYILYSGTLVWDAGGTAPPTTAAPGGGVVNPSDTYVSAHTINASLGFYTQPGTLPVYVAIDVSLMGTGGLNTTLDPQEATLRTRVEGFTTDPFGSSFTGAIVIAGGGGGGGVRTGAVGTAVDISAMDIDCSGVETDRGWIFGVAADTGIPFGGAKAGRWRFRPTGGIFLPPPRNLRATMSDGRRLTTANLPAKPGDPTGAPQGLDTGQYNAPIFEFIFPENLAIGGPTIPANFADFPFLANGSGTYYGAGGIQLGTLQQLMPWPGSPAPSVSCSPDSPVLQNAPEVVAAASTGFISSGGTVTLTATVTDLNLPALAITSVNWTAPTGITLSPNATSSQVTFKAPAVATQTAFTFTATGANSAGLSASASVTVTVNPAPVVPAGAPALVVSAFSGATASVPGSGTPLAAPYRVGFGMFGVQLVARTTANATVSWVKPATLNGMSAISYAGPSSQTNNRANTTTSWLTFSAQWTNTVTGGFGLLPGMLPQPLTFTVSAKDNKTGVTQTQSITVTVVPPPDTVTAQVTYITGALGGGKASKMQVAVTTNAQLTADPNTFAITSPTFTLTFTVSDPNDPRFGQTVVWDSFALILGAPTATVLGFPMPDFVTVKSNAGGSVTVPSTAFTIR